MTWPICWAMPLAPCLAAKTESTCNEKTSGIWSEVFLAGRGLRGSAVSGHVGVIEDGHLRYDGGFTSKEHLLEWVLSFRDSADPLEPKDLRQEMADIDSALLRQ